MKIFRKKAVIILLVIFIASQIGSVSASEIELDSNESIELVWTATTENRKEKFSLYLEEVLTEVNINGEKYTYEYNDFRRSFKKSKSLIVEYRYDENGYLKYENRNSHEIEYLYGTVNNSESIIGIIVDKEKFSYSFIEGTKTVEAIIDSNGYEVAKYIYDEANNATIYGVDKTGKYILKDTDRDFIGTINLIRYNSYYFDEETGYYYDGGFYYDASKNIYIVNNSIKLDEVSTVESYLKYKNVKLTRALTLNQVDQLAEDWKDTLLATSTYGQNMTDVSGWYSSLDDEEIIARLLYGENNFSGSTADRSAIAQVLINRKNSSQFPSTIGDVASAKGAFSTIHPDPYNSSHTEQAREPVKGSNAFIEVTYIACVLELTSDTSIINVLVGKPTNFSNQLYFRALSSFPSSNIRDGSSSMEITYNGGQSYTAITNTYVFDTYSSTRSATFIADVTTIKNAIDESRFNIFFYHP